MNWKQASEHIGKLEAAKFSGGHAVVGGWKWPYPGGCGCGVVGASHWDAGHEEHEAVGNDAYHVAVETAGGRSDFLKVSGEWVRGHTGEEVAELVAAQHFGEVGE